MTDAETAWADHYTLPPKGNMMITPQAFIEGGTRIFATIERTIAEFLPGRRIEEMEILDFGCGVGRVALPFFYKYKRPTACVDLPKIYVDYLKGQIPGANPARSRNEPPLPYPDESFDVVYSISVFTHLNPEMGAAWLKEMHRLLKPGGLALLSTSSHAQLAWHRIAREELWEGVSDEIFEAEGIVFRGEFMKGMGGIYGCTVHTSEWVKANWSKVFTVKDTRVRAVGGTQDLNILMK
ncbi:MAG TPA: class I SAM-dependent methyltransferase [Pseudolabrys sp.]|nr:class I SAM-dependent methyltransferase [Pseudolabrys sp.]